MTDSVTTRQSFRQPHEGITGTDRSSNYLLSLDEAAVAHRDVLMNLTRHLRNACLVGNPAPIVKTMGERIRHPQVGDLVVEASSGMLAPDPGERVKALGVLIARRTEWWTTDEQWEADKAEDRSLVDADRMTDVAWYVQYGPDPADVCRWVNCDFTAVPVDRDFFPHLTRLGW